MSAAEALVDTLMQRCAALEAEVARLRAAIGEIIDRHRWRLMSDDPMLSDLAALRDGGPTR